MDSNTQLELINAALIAAQYSECPLAEINKITVNFNGTAAVQAFGLNGKEYTIDLHRRPQAQEWWVLKKWNEGFPPSSQPLSYFDS